MNATSDNNFAVSKATISVTSSLVTYLRQPSTVLGFSALVGTLTALLTAQISWQAAIPAIAGALAAIVLPDNAGAQVAIKDAASAAVRAEQAVSAPGVTAGAAQARVQVPCAQSHSLGCDRVASGPATLSGR